MSYCWLMAIDCCIVKTLNDNYRDYRDSFFFVANVKLK